MQNQWSSCTVASPADLVKRFEFNSEKGLSSEEAAHRLLVHGENSLETKGTPGYRIFFRQFQSAFIYLLVGAGILAFLLGEAIDGTLIFLFVLINALLGFFQEYHSEKTARLLKKFVVQHARVIRDGKEFLVKSAELVPGDLVVVRAGSKIPADLRFLQDHSLMVDESLLTGESVSVSKSSRSLYAQVSETHQAANIGFAGTTVVSGKGIGVVISTGRQTAMGEVAHLTVSTERRSGFEKGVGLFSRFVLRVVVVTLALVIIANVLIKGEGAQWGELVIFAIALAVSVIPEALPLVTTFSLSRGAQRLAKNKVVLKRLMAIEDLGSIEILCTDKTGTLTENALTVHSLFGPRQETLFAACCAAPSADAHEQHSINAFDIALMNYLPSPERARLKKIKRIDEYPFDPDRRRNSVLIQEGRTRTLIVRGAPEAILDLCKDFSGVSRPDIHKAIREEGRAGRRVLAIAKRTFPGTKSVTLKEEEKNLSYLGMVSFVDPLKKTSLKAIQDARNLGVAIKIITGDSKEVAGAIAFQAGLISSPTDVVSGEEFSHLSPEEQHATVEAHAVFARVSPQQKFSIIHLLREKHAVGYLGDGVNDAPALKVANVGIAVNDAVDIAREAADIILLQKSLSVIIYGIREGREVFANTVKYIRATLSSNFGNFYAVSFASLLLPGLPMLPIQILLLNLLSDFPMMAVATDTVDETEVIKPRFYDMKEIALVATVLGVVSTLFDFLYFGLFRSFPLAELQTNWFMGSVLTELVFLFSIRTKLPFYKSRPPSKTLLVLTGAAALATIILPYTAFGQNALKFVPPSGSILMLILLIAAIYFVVTEIVKNMYYSSHEPHAKIALTSLSPAR